MKSSLSLCLFFAVAVAAPVRGDLAPGLLVPRIASDWTTIATNPELAGLAAAKNPSVNLSIRPSGKGVWQLRLALGKTNEAGTTTPDRVWESPALHAPDWQLISSGVE